MPGVAVGLLLIAVGAILTWGVSAETEGIDLDVVGVVLMVVGAVGILIGMMLWADWFSPRRRARYVEERPRERVVERPAETRETVIEERDPGAPPPP